MTARNAALTALALPLIPVALMAALAVGVLAVVHSLTFGAGRRLGLADRSESTLPLWLALAGVETAAEVETVAPVAPAVEQAQEASMMRLRQAAQVIEPVVAPDPVAETDVYDERAERMAALIALAEATAPLDVAEAVTLTATFEPGDGSPEAVKEIADTRTDAEVMVEAREMCDIIRAAREEVAEADATGKPIDGRPARKPRQPRKGKTVAQAVAVEKPARAPRKPRRRAATA